MKTLIHNAHVIADGFREIPCGAVLVEAVTLPLSHCQSPVHNQ